jgi:HD-GYP domain-containing protein (c-di-GMP phosphodiesterase class II)
LGTIDHYYLHSDGRMHWEEWTDRALYDGQGNFLEFQSVGRDVTEEKQRRREMEAIIAVTSALRFAKTRVEMLPVILNQINLLLSTEGSLLAVYDPQHNDVRVEIGQGIWQNASGRRLSFGSDMMSQVIRSGKPYVSDCMIENPVLPSNPANTELKAVVCVPMIAQDHPVGAIWIGRLYPILGNDLRLLTAIADIAASAIHRASLHEQTQQRLQRLTALRSIDMAISASLDLSVTLSIFINQIISQLGLDAALLLLLNPYTQMLEYRVGQGFRSASIRKSRLHLGESHAGRVALERRMEIVNDLQENDQLSIVLHNIGEDFKSYIGLPLVAKGQVKGVLELFQRKAFDPDPEWLEYVQALAARAAIAIDNGELFEKLQLSNSDMVQAYDATIEGWARVLDLHDGASTSHSLRIVDVTLGLIRAMGESDAEAQNIRWGVLLHDIGMIAIPDQILHKSGPLTDAEWQVVKQHPVNAFDLLSPILYLKKAIEIPYYHQERWDGSGYPHGLTGEQIPFASRVFAVVDVWDALGSDRPYRPAWLPQKIRQYLEDQAGKQFDPQVVKAFLSFEKNSFKASQSLIL